MKYYIIKNIITIKKVIIGNLKRKKKYYIIKNIITIKNE